MMSASRRTAGTAALVLLFLFSGARAGGGDKTKIVIVGLDGASWKVITPLVEKGEMPNLKALMDRGVYGTIETLRSQVSPVIWTSVATGKSPEKHGIRDLLFFDDSEGIETLGRSYLRTAKALWNIAGERNKRVGVYNWWITYPAEQVNGYIVTNLYQIDPAKAETDTALVYPPHLKLPSFPARQYPASGDVFDKAYAMSIWNISKDTATSVFLQQALESDLLMVYTRETDLMQHLFWKFMRPEDGFRNDPLPPSEKQKALFRDTIPEVYRTADHWIGELVKNADENNVFIVLSDHGFKGCRKPDVFLYVKRILDAFDLGKHTVLYQPIAFTAYLRNEKQDREIRELFRSIVTADGKSVFTVSDSDRKGFNIKLEYRSIDSFDLSISSKPYRIEKEGFCSFNDFHCSGEHDYDDGIFVMAGKHVKRAGKISGVSVYDIAPTVLYLLGLPVGKDMDGKVAEQAVEEGYRRSHPVRFIESYEEKDKKGTQPVRGTNAAEEELKERLRSLGYIQ